MEIFEPEIINTKVVGVTFEGRQQVVQALERIEQTNKTAAKLFLKQDKENPVDPFAIAVYVTYYDSTFLSEVTRQLGFLKKEIAAQFSDDINSGYDFTILEFETTGGYDRSRGVNIKILRKEAKMTQVTAMDLLKKKAGSSESTEYLRLKENTMLTLRFLKPLDEAYIQATHSIRMPDGKYTRFTASQYQGGVYDQSIEDPAMTIDPSPWIKLVLPVIDRADGKVKLFAETLAMFRKLQLFEEQPANDAEKSVKLGGLTNGDISIMQQGSGKDRQVNVFPVPGTIRPLNDAEKKMKAPDPKNFEKILSTQEINAIVKVASNAQAAQTMTVNAPAPGPFSA